MRRITIFDTTLRDGEQSPGASLNLQEKLQIARQLALLKVDVIEAGFPITSSGDFEAVQAVAESVRGPIICGLARTVEKDIERAWEALRKAARPRIHLFCATSEIHRKYKLHKAKPEILRIAVSSVRQARRHCPDVEFSPEDASRTEPQFLTEVVSAVIEAGATTVNIPDTVGYALPEQFAALIRYLRERVPNIHAATISVHCHNDLGLAVANSLAAVQAGADQVECTINGLGERAGNAALEEIVMAIKTRRDFFQACTGIATHRLTGHEPHGQHAHRHPGAAQQGDRRRKRLRARGGNPPGRRPEGAQDLRDHAAGGRRPVAQPTGPRQALRPARAPRPGARAGVQADGRATRRSCSSGSRRWRTRRRSSTTKTLKRSWRTSSRRSTALPDRVVAHQQRDARDADRELWLRGPKDEILKGAASGDGPVDAAYRAIERLTGVAARLKDYRIRSVTMGEDAQGEVSVEVECKGQRVSARAVSTDIIQASALAYLKAINSALARRKRKEKRRLLKL